MKKTATALLLAVSTTVMPSLHASGAKYFESKDEMTDKYTYGFYINSDNKVNGHYGKLYYVCNQNKDALLLLSSNEDTTTDDLSEKLKIDFKFDNENLIRLDYDNAKLKNFGKIQMLHFTHYGIKLYYLYQSLLNIENNSHDKSTVPEMYVVYKKLKTSSRLKLRAYGIKTQTSVYQFNLKGTAKLINAANLKNGCSIR